ncbi:MAG: hypothetical protein ACOYO1_18390 [Bacteroidales bacterium]
MKKFICFFMVIFILFSSITFSQNKPVLKKKTSASIKKEIDILADKYKGSDNITVYTSHGEMTGSISIEYNPDNKPQAVSISFSTDNEEIAKEFINNIIKQKQKQGYHCNDYYDTYNTQFVFFYITETIYTFIKNSMYFIISGHIDSYPNHTSENRIDFFGNSQINTEPITYTYNYVFSIETGDNSRKGGKNAEKFEF